MRLFLQPRLNKNTLTVEVLALLQAIEVRQRGTLKCRQICASPIIQELLLNATPEHSIHMRILYR